MPSLLYHIAGLLFYAKLGRPIGSPSIAFAVKSYVLSRKMTMLRKIFLIILCCGLTIVSVSLEYRARAETYICPPPRVCVPEVKIPNCEVAPRPRACEPLKRPQKLSLEAVAIDPLQSVSRVSTLDMMRAMSR